MKTVENVFVGLVLLVLHTLNHSILHPGTCRGAVFPGQLRVHLGGRRGLRAVSPPRVHPRGSQDGAAAADADLF